VTVLSAAVSGYRIWLWSLVYYKNLITRSKIPSYCIWLTSVYLFLPNFAAKWPTLCLFERWRHLMAIASERLQLGNHHRSFQWYYRWPHTTSPPPKYGPMMYLLRPTSRRMLPPAELKPLLAHKLSLNMIEDIDKISLSLSAVRCRFLPNYFGPWYYYYYPVLLLLLQICSYGDWSIVRLFTSLSWISVDDWSSCLWPRFIVWLRRLVILRVNWPSCTTYRAVALLLSPRFIAPFNVMVLVTVLPQGSVC